MNEDFTIPGETGTNAFVREGYDLIGWSFDQTTTPEQFHEAVTQVGDSTPEERQELAKLGLFEINENVAAVLPDVDPTDTKPKAVYKTFDEQMETADQNVKILYQDLANYILSMGDDISETHLKFYAAFKKIKNVVTVVANKKKLIINLSLDVNTVTFEEGFSRDVTNLGHWGCGAVELHLQNSDDLEKAKPFIDRAYNEN